MLSSPQRRVLASATSGIKNADLLLDEMPALLSDRIRSRMLEDGDFGAIYVIASGSKEPHLRCVKEIKRGLTQDESTCAAACREFQNQLDSKSKFVLSVFAFYEIEIGDRRRCFLEMPYVPGGDLISCDLTDARHVFVYWGQLLAALEHMHSLGIAHRDVKPDNMLLSHDTQQILLCDFGSAIRCPRGELVSGTCGTKGYSPPETRKGRFHDPYMVDVWASAITLFAFLTTFLPWNNASLKDPHFSLFVRVGRFDASVLASQAVTLNCNLATMPINNLQSITTYNDVLEVITSCLQIDFSTRPTISQLRKHAFASFTSFEDLEKAFPK